MKGHFLVRQRDPHSNKVPNFVDSIHRITLRSITTSGSALSIIISATYAHFYINYLKISEPYIHADILLTLACVDKQFN